MTEGYIPEYTPPSPEYARPAGIEPFNEETEIDDTPVGAKTPDVVNDADIVEKGTWPDYEPIPVYIVPWNDRPNVVRHNFSTYQLASVSLRVLGTNRNRISSKLQNTGTSDIFVGSDSALANHNSFLLASGKNLTLETTESVWVFGDGGQVSIMETYKPET